MKIERKFASFIEQFPINYKSFKLTFIVDRKLSC